MKKNSITFDKVMSFTKAACTFVVAMSLALAVASCGGDDDEKTPDDGKEQTGDDGNKDDDKGGNKDDDKGGNKDDGKKDPVTPPTPPAPTTEGNLLSANQYGFEATGVWFALNSTGKFIIPAGKSHTGQALKYTYDAAKSTKEQSITANGPEANFVAPAGKYVLSLWLYVESKGTGTAAAGIGFQFTADATASPVAWLGLAALNPVPDMGFTFTDATVPLNQWTKVSKTITLPETTAGKFKVDFNAQYIQGAVVFLDDIELVPVK